MEALARKPLNKLHIGCFDRSVPGWLNTDITPHIWIARVPLLADVLHFAGMMSAERLEQHQRGVFRGIHYMNASKRFPYPDNSFDVVFSSHFLEHLLRDQAMFCLSEVFRVLRPKGISRIVLPDLDKIVSSYVREDPEPFLRSMFEYPARTAAKNLHHWMYNHHSLARMCSEIGFSRTVKCAFRQGDCPDIDELDNRPHESLFLEAFK